MARNGPASAFARACPGSRRCCCFSMTQRRSNGLPRSAPAGRGAASALQARQRPGRSHPQEHALSLPRRPQAIPGSRRGPRRLRFLMPIQCENHCLRVLRDPVSVLARLHWRDFCGLVAAARPALC